MRTVDQTTQHHTTPQTQQLQKTALRAAGIARSTALQYIWIENGKRFTCTAKNGNDSFKLPLIYCFKKTASPSCRCGHRDETIDHFVLQRPYYKEQRESMFQNISETHFPNFENESSQAQLDVIIRGTNISGGGGRSVALPFQIFLLQSKRFGKSS